MKRIAWNLRSHNPYWHTFLHIGKQRIHCLWSSFIQIDLHGHVVIIAIGRYKVRFWKGWWKEDIRNILSKVEISNRLKVPTYMRLRDENPYQLFVHGTVLKKYAKHPYFKEVSDGYKKT